MEHILALVIVMQVQRGEHHQAESHTLANSCVKSLGKSHKICANQEHQEAYCKALDNFFQIETIDAQLLLIK